MFKLLTLVPVFTLVFTVSSCKNSIQSDYVGNNKESNKNSIVGGGCDGCELMYVDMPKDINSIDTSAAWFEKGQRLIINGTVKKSDGVTPAREILIYYWHTDDRGYYSPSSDQNEKSKKHGHIRGWVKTDINGKYFINTIKPAPYPNDTLPAHIHISVKEPNIKNEYYIDDLVFNDDILLTNQYRNKLPNRGGSGILNPIMQDKILVTSHNLTLGLNIPNYPK